ncbi:D-inositol-3-phosphate glycosyltransferase [Candidatus Planktophila sulfonica]|uniref:D-inositol-3-phosphate glycosyltransferase n=1 Tax=Candidatus Planktophila sulfonica TaxID=1884904 RepID=A0A249KF19_9ACTN|nr:D-inositol-3-phosphate glycosyltransferase [Candidatus Planktophila sulfonica]ASY15400.1 D-inositol-3-phosphate glycosyltransferase [Candidatus Planktophila sulfonica]
MTSRRIATLMVHTSPLDQAGTGDAGGMNIYVCEAAQNMAAMGVQVDIFTRRTNNEVADVVEVAPGVRVIQLNVGPVSGVTKELLPKLIPDLPAAFKEALLATRYDIIHSHYWISGKVAMPVAKELNIPLVHTMHTMARVKNLNLAEGEVPEPMIRVQGETQVVAAADALVANTDAEAASLVSLYEACPDNVLVVSPGVNLKVFTPGAGRMAAREVVGLDKDSHIITFVGRIQPHKGPEVLIRSIAELVSHSPHLRTKLITNIIGGASGANQSEVERLKELTTWLGIDDVVRFAPPVPREELPQWYRASDLVCVPSYSESFGLVALEAQACGTPVVATAVGGLRTAVADGISGVLVDGHDPRAWSSVLARLLQEPQRRVLLSMGAIEHASHFGWDATSRGTLDIYDRVLTARAEQAKNIG